MLNCPNDGLSNASRIADILAESVVNHALGVETLLLFLAYISFGQETMFFYINDASFRRLVSPCDILRMRVEWLFLT